METDVVAIIAPVGAALTAVLLAVAAWVKKRTTDDPAAVLEKIAANMKAASSHMDNFATKDDISGLVSKAEHERLIEDVRELHKMSTQLYLRVAELEIQVRHHHANGDRER